MIKRFRFLQVWFKTSDIWRWLSDLKIELFEAFQILMFFDEWTLNINLLMFFAAYFTSLFIFLVFARPRIAKLWIFERASKSSHFRLDNQRQISLDLSHSCRDRKRLINLINLRNFYVVILQAHCEYNEHVKTKNFFVSRRILSWFD